MDPNELVTITNSKTKAVKRVKRSDLPTYGLPTDYQSQADIYAQGVMGDSELTVDKVPEAYRGGVQAVLNEKGFKKKDPKETEADKKRKESLSAISNLIGNLEEHYQSAGGGSFGSGPFARLLGSGRSLEGKLGFNDSASTYNDEREGFAATLKSLTGDTGVLTDQDYARLQKLLPELGSTPGEAKNKLNDLRSQVAARFGGEATPTSINPQTPESATGNPLTDFLFGTSVNIAKDAGAGITANMTEGARNQATNQAEQTATQLEEQAMRTNNMQQRQALLAEANQIRGQVSQQAQAVSDSFSADVTQNPLIRSLIGATQIGGAAEAPALVQGGKALLTKGASGLKNNFTMKGISAQRDAAVDAAKNVSFSGDEIAKAAKEYVKDDPLANPILKKILPSIEGKNIPTDQLMKKIDVWNDAYTQAGRVGKSAEAGINNALAQAAKSLMKTEVPDVSKANKMFQRQYALEKAGKKALGAGMLGGVGGGGYEIIRALFGGR